MTLASDRRAARERALGLLYEAEAKATSGVEVLAGLPIAADEYAVVLVRAVDEHRERIDEILTRYAEGWTLARMAALDRAALRMGAAELIARPDVPTGVVLAETVELASRFSTDGSGRFVNGLLARVAEVVRGGGSGPAEATAAPEPARAPLVQGLVIDLDGVIRHWDETYYPEADASLGLPDGTLVAAALDPDRLARATDGRITFEEWCSEIADALAAEHGVDRDAVADAWAMSRWRMDLAVLEMVAEAREVVPVALLSNASTRLSHDLELSEVLDEFDAVIGSADIGAAKPEPAAYQAAVSALGLEPGDCLFVDDTAANVEGARSAGLTAELFTGVEELRALLRRLDLVT